MNCLQNPEFAAVVIGMKILFFRVVLGSQQTWCEGTEISHVPPPPTHEQPSPIINIPQHDGTFLTFDEPMLSDHNYPKSIVYIKIHS